ncbi:MAG: NAD-binding protein [Phycisphaerales bacterium]|nr:NAD-binding protein [Phycisphaerales bacterium]
MATTAPNLPIYIRPGNLQTSSAIEARVHRKLAGAFRRYGAKMTAVEVHFEDVNGQKHGGENTRCVMEARVNGRIPIAVRAGASDLYAAIDAAARKLDAAISKAVERRHTRARRRFRQERGRDDAPARSAATGVQGHAPVTSDGPLADEPQSDRRKKVIIAGYGPVGRALAEELRKLAVPFTVVDTNPATVRTQETLGVSVLCGDATDPEVLRAAGIETAAAFAVTIPDGDEAVRACAAARTLAPEVHIAARITFLSQGIGALTAGANTITVEEIATAKSMARKVSQQVAEAGIAATSRPPPAPARL